jgi:hypothetical protein
VRSHAIRIAAGVGALRLFRRHAADCWKDFAQFCARLLCFRKSGLNPSWNRLFLVMNFAVSRVRFIPNRDDFKNMSSEF